MAEKIVFIDINGTLFNDWPIGYRGVKEIYSRHNKLCPSMETYIRYVAEKGNYYQFYADHGLPKVTPLEFNTTFLATYFQHIHAVDLFPEVLPVLHELRKQGIKLYAITAAIRNLAEPLLTRSGAHDLFTERHYCITDKAACMREVINETGVTASECVMIGDLPADMHAARSAGVRGIMFLNPDIPRDIFSDVIAHYATDHLDSDSILSCTQIAA